MRDVYPAEMSAPAVGSQLFVSRWVCVIYWMDGAVYYFEHCVSVKQDLDQGSVGVASDHFRSLSWPIGVVGGKPWQNRGRVTRLSARRRTALETPRLTSKARFDGSRGDSSGKEGPNLRCAW